MNNSNSTEVFSDAQDGFQSLSERTQAAGRKNVKVIFKSMNLAMAACFRQ